MLRARFSISVLLFFCFSSRSVFLFISQSWAFVLVPSVRQWHAVSAMLSVPYAVLHVQHVKVQHQLVSPMVSFYFSVLSHRASCSYPVWKQRWQKFRLCAAIHRLIIWSSNQLIARKWSVFSRSIVFHSAWPYSSLFYHYSYV